MIKFTHIVLGLALVFALMTSTFALPDDDLISAVGSRSASNVEEALKAGANVNAINKRGEPVLFRALERWNKDIAELLLTRGANVNFRTESGWTALHEVVGNSFDLDSTELREATKLLLAKGANVNARSADGRTPLAVVLESHNRKDVESRRDIAELLLAHGADINIRDQDGWTPLHRVVGSYSISDDKERLPLVAFLVVKCANLNIRNSDGKTPMELATSTSYRPTDIREKIINLLKSGQKRRC